MSEKLLTGTLNLNTNKNKLKNIQIKYNDHIEREMPPKDAGIKANCAVGADSTLLSKNLVIYRCFIFCAYNFSLRDGNTANMTFMCCLLHAVENAVS